MNKSIFLTLISLFVGVARQAYLRRVTGCQSLPSPDRAEQCIELARMTFERDSQTARARYATEVRACRTES